MIIPSLIPNHIWASLSDTLANLDIVSQQCPFGLLEIWDENTDDFEQHLKKALNNINIDVYLSPIMQKQGLDLIGANTKEIHLSLDYIKKRIITLAKCGISDITLSSPKRRTDISYNESLEMLEESIHIICSYCDKFTIKVGFEAFDVNKDKCRLLGKTDELLKFFTKIKKEEDNFALTWDSGHFALEEENLIESLKKLKKYIRRIHISNYSLNYTQWYYGDKHLPFDSFGSMSITMIEELIKFVNTEMNNTVESVSFEVACQPKMTRYSSAIEIINHIISMLSILEVGL